MIVVLRVLAGLVVLLAFFGLGSLVAGALGLPLPGSVVGMLGLWAALEAGVVRLDWIEEGAARLLGILGFLFVPAGAGFVAFVDAGWVWLGAVVVTGLGALVTIGVTGLVAQRGMRRG